MTHAEVSGRAFLGLIKHLKEVHGGALIARIQADAGGALDSVLGARIRGSAWYPYASYVTFLHTAQRVTAPNDRQFYRALGEAAGKRDLNTVFRIYVTLASPERLIRACDKIWPLYHRNAGRMEAVAWAPESTVLRIFDFPTMDRAHCRLMEGWMISTMDTIGLRVGPNGRETMCMSDGAPFHEFSCTWEKKGRL